MIDREDDFSTGQLASSLSLSNEGKNANKETEVNEF
jgi:hypothetical protein